MDATSSLRLLSNSIITRTDLEITIRRLFAGSDKTNDEKKQRFHRRRFERQQILEILVHIIQRDLTGGETLNSLEIATNTDMTLAVCDLLLSAFNTDNYSVDCLSALIGTISWCTDSVIYWPYKHAVMKLFRLLSSVYVDSCQNSSGTCFRCKAIRKVQREMIRNIGEDCFALAVTDTHIYVASCSCGRVVRRIMTSTAGDYDFCDLLVDLLQSPELPEPIVLMDVFRNTFAKELFALGQSSIDTVTFLNIGQLQHWIKQLHIILQNIRAGFVDASLLDVLLVQVPSLLMSTSLVASIVLLALSDVVHRKEAAASQEFMVRAILDYNILPYVVPFMCLEPYGQHNITLESMPLEVRSSLRFVLALNESASNNLKYPYLYQYFFEDRHGITSTMIKLMPLWTSRPTTIGCSNKGDLEKLLFRWVRDMARYAHFPLQMDPSFNKVKYDILDRIREAMPVERFYTLIVFGD